LRYYVLQHLGNLQAVLLIDEAGLLKKGQHSVGVVRQDRGTVYKVHNGQIGVFLGCARALGRALLDHELYVPEKWTDECDRCRQASMPAAQGFATEPQLARQMLQRAFAVGVPPKWVMGDSVYGTEWGIGMTRFGTAAHLAAWGGATPGNDVSAGK
jgi:SRSO17 transposase